MEINLRSKRNRPIIESSDSDDENHKTFAKSSDDDYVVEECETKKRIIAGNKEPGKKGLRKNIQSTNVTTKSVKRKNQKENLETFNNKRLKLEKPSTSDNPNLEVLQQNQKNLSKFDTKHEEKFKTDIKTEQKYKIDVKTEESLKSNLSQCMEWTIVDYISETNNINKHIADNIVHLFKNDNTIPFIARYRKHITGSMEANQLRRLKKSLEKAKMIKQRAATIITAIDKLGKWSPELHSAITSTKRLSDLEYIYSLYKTTSKRLLAERAQELGLGKISNAVLQGEAIPPLISLINKQKKGLQSEEEVRNGILHIIADVVNKDKEVLDKARSLQEMFIIDIQTKQCKVTKDLTKADEKYQSYFNFKSNVNIIKPYQILAINRAESQKIINVKIILSNAFECALKNYCSSRYAHKQEVAGSVTKLHQELLNDSIDYAYKKYIKPLVVRRVRSKMKEKAETASIEVFATNVKQLLLTSPLRGKVVLGIDPGYSHGCKLAVVSAHGDVLETNVIHPHKYPSEFEKAAATLANLVYKYKCTVIALGNATGCRDTESFLTKMLKSNMLNDAMYTIVDESGASTYSCSPEAKSEFPDLDPNIISAISIARRLQDPLAEYVKVEPKHLGVGMYQHDLPEKQLMNALDEVITETVSFVGVDMNTASQCLLRRVAGLTNSRAANIIEWRTKHGAFRNREQLLNVKGIGKKTFEQCVGFMRILPETAMVHGTLALRNETSNGDLNLLDQTWIHPESYAIANRFVKHCNCKLNDLGTARFIETINSYAKAGCAKLAAQFDTDEATMEVIIKALTMKKDEDIRLKSDSPLFRNGMQYIDDLVVGTVVKGIVRNVTHFGAFVDLGMTNCGLIHITKMRKTLHVSQRVEVKIINVDAARARIGLELIN